MGQEEKLALPVGTTLDRFINRNEKDFPYATGELSQLLRDVGLAAKILNREINRAGLNNLAGAFGEQNVQGEDQQKLDVIADVRFTRAFRNGGEVCAIISEEDSDVIELNNKSKYIIAIDPLDGSSNIDANVSIGTIFSVYRRKSEPGTPVVREDLLQSGRNQVAAGYLLYGSSTMLVYTTGKGVYGFTYEPSLGDFFLSHQDMTIPKEGSTYSVNEGNYNDFSPGVREFISRCKEKRYSARYIGSLIADFHRNLLKGGMYMYPATQDKPNGKLRLLYECNALALVVEQAGGKATDGTQPILDIQPTEFHQRAPLYIGSVNMVDAVMESLQAHG